MAHIVAVAPPPLPVLACPQAGCHGHVTIDGPHDPGFWSCTVCQAEWTLDGDPIVIRHDCLDCGAVNVAASHDCDRYLGGAS